MTTITALPPAPTRGDAANFAAVADTFVAALPTFVTQANAVAGEVNTAKTAAESAATTATSAAGSASASASSASSNASTASTAATTATTKAGEASASASAAAASAAAALAADAGAVNGIVKGNGAGAVSAAVAGADFVQPGTVVTLTGNQTVAGVKTFTSMPVLPAQSMVRLNTANGYGSTNTKIRRFTNVVTNQGTNITYADSAANGASFTINVSGVYAISYTEQFTTGGGHAGLSLNSSQLTTNASSITAANLLSAAYATSASEPISTACTVYLTAGDVVRPHTHGEGAGALYLNACQFTIVRVG